MRLLVVMLIAGLDVGIVSAFDPQSSQRRTTFAPIMRTERASAGVVRIVYDLNGAAGALFSVSLEISNDGGQSFAVRATALTGDVGLGVSAGDEKTIVWDSAKDIEDLQLERFVFRVRVTSGGAADAAPSRASPLSPSTPPSTGSGGRGGATSTGAKKSGGLSKGAIAALVGGGAAAGVGVALKGGGGSSVPSAPASSAPASSTPPPPSSGTVSRSFTAALSGTWTLTGVCRQTENWTGTLTVLLNLPASGTGNVTGSASANVSGVLASFGAAI